MRLSRVCVRVRSAALAAVAVLVAPAIARAADPAAAREQLKMGYELAQEGKCDKAIPHLQESLRLDPRAITLINLASCEEKTGRWAAALGHWADARGRAQAESASLIEEEAGKRARDLEKKIPRLTIVLGSGAPSGTEVARDGVALGAVSLGVAMPVDPGPHSVVARAPGHASGTKTITLAEGESGRIEVAPGEVIARAATTARGDAASGGGQTSGSSGGTSPLVWIGFGTAIAGVTIGSISGLLALERGSNAKEACPENRCADPADLDRVDGGRTLGWISTISFAVAGAGALVGIYGLVTVKPAPNGVALAGRF
jgi:hypothetical protein